MESWGVGYLAGWLLGAWIMRTSGLVKYSLSILHLIVGGFCQGCETPSKGNGRFIMILHAAKILQSRACIANKKEGFGINYSLGTVTPGLPTLKREFILNSLFS